VRAGAFSCSFEVPAPSGSDTFDVVTFDQSGAQGNQLSSIVDFPFVVKLGTDNHIAMTLDGIFAKVGITLLGTSFLATGDDTHGFRFAGEGNGAMQRVLLTADDADGNVIVSPSIAATFTLTSNAPAKVTISSVDGAPGLFKLTPLAETNALPSPDPSTAITLTATGTPATGKALTANVPLQLEPVAYSSNPHGQVWPLVPWLTQTYSISSPPPGTIDLDNSDAGSYQPMALDKAGNLYVAWSEAGEITVYPPGSNVPSRTITGLTNIGDAFTAGTMAVDSSGNIFVVAQGVVEEFTPEGGNTPARSLSTESQGIDVPRGVAVDAAGNLYVGNIGRTHAVSVFPPDTSVTTPSYSLGDPADGPEWVSFDAAGDLYVSNGFNSPGLVPKVDEYRPPLTSASTIYKTFGSSATFSGEPLAASVDGNGNLYVPDMSNESSRVLEFSPAAPSVVVRNLYPAYLSSPVDQLGNVYVQDDFNTLYVYPPGTSAIPIDFFDGLYFPTNVVVWP
jgi:hypothetical protein